MTAKIYALADYRPQAPKRLPIDPFNVLVWAMVAPSLSLGWLAFLVWLIIIAT